MKYAKSLFIVRRLTTCFLLLALASLLTFGQVSVEKIDAEINAKIRDKTAKNSRLLHTIHVLTDIYSPRMTGTPNLKLAQDWAMKELTGYGLQNTHFENWDFGFPGWQNEKLSVHAVSPFKESSLPK